jgi:transposase
MSNQKSLENTSGFVIKLLDPGLTQEESNLSQEQGVHVSTILKVQPLEKQKKQNISTVECLPVSKKKTSKDKSCTSLKNIQDTKSSKKSPVESTLKGRGSKGFWTNAHTEMSQRLWLPTKTGSVGSRGNTSNGCSTDLGSLSWSTVKRITQIKPRNKNSQRTSCQSYMFFLQGTTVVDGNILRKQNQTTRVKTLRIQEMKTRARKIKDRTDIDFNQENVFDYIPSTSHYILEPTKPQNRIFNDNFASTRKVWNSCLHHIYREKVPLKEATEDYLRNKFVIKKNMSSGTIKQLDWTFRTQKRIREYAVKDLVATIKGGLTRVCKRQIKSFTINPKSKNEQKQTISLCHENSYIKNNRLHVYGMDIKIKEKVEDRIIDNNMRLVKEGLIYHLFIPKFSSFKYKEEEKWNSYEEFKRAILPKDIVSIDLGVNIFASYFSPENEWGEVGGGFKDKLKFLYEKEKGIQCSHRITPLKKLRLQKKYERKRFNLVDDLQWKSAHWFLKSFKEILVSRLYVGRSSGITKRYMNDSRHCRFVDRLEYLSMFYEGRKVHTGKEYYTSTHCSGCGSSNTIKGTTIKCLDCGLEIHRDLSGSRTFLIKYLVA